MSTPKGNVIVVGGSYVGRATAQELARIVPATHRVILIEPHSHFHHLFAFPRFAIVPGHEQKAFIPYSSLFLTIPNASSHLVVHARVLTVQPQHLELDREWQGSSQISFEYLVIATGMLLAQPAAMRYDDKISSIQYLKKHQNSVRQSKSIVIIGGGAVGVQMATDLKEYYPDKEVTVVQSRTHVMPNFNEKLHFLIKERFDKLGIHLFTGSRVVIPENGFPTGEGSFKVQLINGPQLEADLVILATGQTPNNTLVAGLPCSTADSVVNPVNGCIRVLPTMQLLDDQYPNIFAVGDIADTGIQKAARPGVAQAAVAAKNIRALIDGEAALEKFEWGPAGIHLTLGMKYNVIFRNANGAEGQTEPYILEKTDGREDMDVDAMWQRLGVNVNGQDQYHL